MLQLLAFVFLLEMRAFAHLRKFFEAVLLTSGFNLKKLASRRDGEVGNIV